MPTMPAVEATTCATAAPPACDNVVEDLFGFLRVLSDGTVVRAPEPAFCPSTFPDSHPSVQWKEAVYDKAKNLRVCMYKPIGGEAAAAAGGKEEKAKKLPVLVHFHGGGFCLGSCTRSASASPRMAAPSCCRRLTASRRSTASPRRWRTASGSCAGSATSLTRGSPRPPTWAASLSSATRRAAPSRTTSPCGPVVARSLALAARPTSGDGDDDHQLGRGHLGPGAVTVRGYVLLMPFFGGVGRTASEAQCPAEVFLNLDLIDRFWRLSLPAGATRDHPAANPLGPDSPPLDSVEFRPVLVVVGGLDMLRDRAVDYAPRLKAMGQPVEVAEFAGQPHGFYTLEPGSEPTGELIRVLRRFVSTPPLLFD